VRKPWIGALWNTGLALDAEHARRRWIDILPDMPEIEPVVVVVVDKSTILLESGIRAMAKLILREKTDIL
jgi:hypothetical protein